MMRYCATIACVRNPSPTALVSSSHVLQFSNAIIGQGLFEEPAATTSFRLPRSAGMPKSLSEALIQCEQSTVRTACLLMNATQFAATTDGVCTACLEAANWNVVTGSPPISKTRILLKCFSLFRAGYVAPTTLKTSATAALTVASTAVATSSPGSSDSEAMSDTAVLTKDNIGVIAGAAGGAAVLLLLIVIMVLIVLRSRRRQSSSSGSQFNERVEANNAPTLTMEPDRSSGNMSSARSSAGVSNRGSAQPSAPISRTQYEDFDDMQDVKDKDPRTMANPAVRTAEQQRQIDSIKQRQQR
jgi:hypothetical protein